jgi:hypothetical protein
MDHETTQPETSRPEIARPAPKSAPEPAQTPEEPAMATCSFCGADTDIEYQLVENTTLCPTCQESGI